MKYIDLQKVSRHVTVDRQTRISIIEKTVGWGKALVEAPDKKGRDCTALLTSTGVIAILEPDGTMVTAWIASVKQAQAVYKRATGSYEMPKELWKMVNYNNNTELWHKMAA